MCALLINSLHIFDKAHHDKLIESLQMFDVGDKNIGLISDLKRKQAAAIKINNEITSYTEIKGRM